MQATGLYSDSRQQVQILTHQRGISNVKIYNRRVGFIFSQWHYSWVSDHIVIDGSLGNIHNKKENRLEKLNTGGFHRPRILRMD
jgi:hypothetical protein